MVLNVGLAESVRRQETDDKHVSAILTVIIPGFQLFHNLYILCVISFYFYSLSYIFVNVVDAE